MQPIGVPPVSLPVAILTGGGNIYWWIARLAWAARTVPNGGRR